MKILLTTLVIGLGVVVLPEANHMAKATVIQPLTPTIHQNQIVPAYWRWHRWHHWHHPRPFFYNCWMDDHWGYRHCP